MDLKFSVVLLLGFCVVVKSQDTPGDCEIDVENIWVKKVINADVDNNATDTKWSYNAKNIKFINITNEKYVSVEFQNDKLTFKLRPDFSNYVEQETSSRIDNKLLFSCENGKTHDGITFVVDVKETFNHKPEFQGAPYNFLLPMPLTAGQDLLVTITAKDIDLKNRKLNFEVIGEYAGIFEFTESIKNGKEYTTHLKTKTAFEIFENFDIQIQVTDDHSTEPKKSMETIKIEIDKQNSVIPIPIFEKPLYHETYGINTVVTTHLVHTQLEPKETKIDEAYRDYFSIKVEGNSIIITPTNELSSDLLNEKNYVIFILETNYDGLKSPGKTVILLDIEAKPGPADYVKYKNKKYNYEKATDYLGNLSEIKAESTIAEQIIYTIKDTSNDNVLKPNLEYSSVGMLTIHSKIDPGSYSITLQAKGVTTKTVDTAKVLLNINSVSECNGKSYFPNSLIVKELDEEKESIVFSEIDDHSFEITGDNQNGWFTIKDKGLWINKIDREDELISSMYMSQIKTMIQITSGTTYTPARNSGLALINSWKANDDTNIYGPCFYTSSIEYNTKRMTVAVIIKDINDNPPVFEMSNPFIIGYPNKNLAEFIAPPYLVQLKASDKDIGYNALIKYSTDSSKFTVDPHTGIVYPGKNTFKEDEDIDFTIAATDQDGNGQKTVLDVKVKILKEEYLSTVVVKNVLYTDLDAFVSKISKETGKTVRYITSTGMFEIKDDTSAAKNYMYKSDEKIPVLKIIMYALDTNGEPIPSKEFKNLIEESVSEIETEQYKPPFDSNHSGSDEGDTNHSGWIAAVSTLSVLLALVIIGVLVGYIVLIRPKMIAARPSHSYTKHDTRNSVHNAPVEEKLESSVATRRPTGFPPNFNASDLDTAEIENEKEVSDSENEEEKNQSDSSSDVGSTGRRKSMVKFDKNVTEIEIDEF